MRVHELAKEYGIKATEFVDVIQGFGFDIKSHLSSLDDAQVSDIRHKMSIKDQSIDAGLLLKEVPAEDIPPEVKEWVSKDLPPEGFDGGDDSTLIERAQNALNEQEESQKELDIQAQQITDKLRETKQEQYIKIDKPRGFFGWIASLFS